MEGVDDGQTSKGVQTLENQGASMATDDQENISNFSLTSITIITTVTYAAAFQLPGGYDSNTGMPVLRNHPAFWYFLVLNSLSFLFSGAVMFYHSFKISKQSKKTILQFLTYCSISFMLFAYSASLSVFLYRSKVQSRSSAPPPK